MRERGICHFITLGHKIRWTWEIWNGGPFVWCCQISEMEDDTTIIVCLICYIYTILYTYRLCVCFLLLICQRTKYLLILAAPSFRKFCYRRKNLFWFQWFSSGDPSIPQNHRLHSASKFVADTVTYIFLREHYGTLASLNFYHQVVLPADSLPICRTAACRLEVLECLGFW